MERQSIYSHYAILVGSDDPDPRNLVRGFYNRFQAIRFAEKENPSSGKQLSQTQHQSDITARWQVLNRQQVSVDYPELIPVCA